VAPAVFSAANEAAVDLFLSEQIGFAAIADCIRAALDAHTPVDHPSLEAIRAADRAAREVVLQTIVTS
jgi:1-deoxy-D-xylulose-5-phosphate reductoisomerase